jgi:hypothetical protein
MRLRNELRVYDTQFLVREGALNPTALRTLAPEAIAYAISLLVRVRVRPHADYDMNIDQPYNSTLMP